MPKKELVEKEEQLPDKPQGDTGIVVQEKKTREEAVSERMVNMIEKAGTIKLTKKQEKALYAPVKDEDVLIRPDGQLYLPWGWYQERLRKTFGFQWTLFPGGKVNKVDDLMIREWWLVIEGKPYGNCYGACEYKPNNPVMDYDDAVEGTRSNAIMRLCKHLGVATELWIPSWIKKWKDKYAIIYYDKKKNKYLWRKKEKNEINYPEKDKPTVEEDTGEAEDGYKLPATLTIEEGNTTSILTLSRFFTEKELNYFKENKTKEDRIKEELAHRNHFSFEYKPKSPEIYRLLSKTKKKYKKAEWKKKWTKKERENFANTTKSDQLNTIGALWEEAKEEK
jgi:hypothetical protein